jgi:AraC-like DNA-binding protein/CheY-like chemotaxis protein
MKEISLIFNNSKRLLRLINQLLDFRKIEDRKFILKTSKTNLFNFSKLILQDFEKEAHKRNINFNIKCNNEDLDIYVDRNLMDKIYFNLLSNAFKFTPDNGTVTIDIVDEDESNFVRIHFKDSGIGIPIRELNQVFKAFYQGSNNNKSSSGIGLHLSKEFVEMHKGTIEVNSKHGTEFIVKLYKGNAHLGSDEIVFEPDLIDDLSLDFHEDYEDTSFFINDVKDDDRYSVLIIEDNLDLITYLKGKLSVEYTIYTSDGSDGIEQAIEHIPDIIICDYNLPDKNGFVISRTLKNDLRTSHIPIIILTAYSDKEFYIKGLESGADLYLTKPFSFAILSQSIKTQLYNREKLRYYFTHNIYKVESENKFGLFEQDFIKGINSLIDDNLDNSNFSVEAIADKLNISRVQLYRKFKAILGIKISDYVQNTRLDKAKVLLKTSSLTISEIAYATGFSSPNYFSTSFKNKFDKSPKAYREE